jgi:hypothetical protein
MLAWEWVEHRFPGFDAPVSSELEVVGDTGETDAEKFIPISTDFDDAGAEAVIPPQIPASPAVVVSKDVVAAPKGPPPPSPASKGVVAGDKIPDFIGYREPEEYDPDLRKRQKPERSSESSAVRSPTSMPAVSSQTPATTEKPPVPPSTTPKSSVVRPETSIPAATTEAPKPPKKATTVPAIASQPSESLPAKSIPASSKPSASRTPVLAWDWVKHEFPGFTVPVLEGPGTPDQDLIF